MGKIDPGRNWNLITSSRVGRKIAGSFNAEEKHKVGETHEYGTLTRDKKGQARASAALEEGLVTVTFTVGEEWLAEDASVQRAAHLSKPFRSKGHATRRLKRAAICSSSKNGAMPVLSTQ